MELETFIRETLLGIKNGVRAANLHLATAEGKELGVDASAAFVLMNDKEGNIDFDIAVTVSSETATEAGAGIKIAVARLGADMKEASALQHVSRIRFAVQPHKRTG